MPQQQQFSGNPGIQCPVPVDVLGYTQLFCLTSDDLELCAAETNRYADQYFQLNPLESHRPHSRVKSWVPTTGEEMKLFFAIVIGMGLVVKPKLSDYWTVDPIMCTPGFGQIMTRNRFELILKFFHLADNAKLIPRNQEGHDPIFRVREMLNRYADRCRTVYIPDQEIALDEATVPWKGNLSFKIYNPKKPVKFGIKIYMLCESKSGYISEWQVYTGKSADDGDGKTHKVIMELTKNFREKGYHLYLDRYYTSPKIFYDLYKLKIGATGTIQSNRKFLPPIVGRKLNKGQVVSFHEDNLVVCKWKDKRDILMISTITSSELVKTGKKDTKTQNDIMKPKCVVEYNKHMGGVDRSDQICGYYYISRKTMKHWKKLALHCLNAMISNGYVIYRKYSSDSSLMSHYDFRLQLMKELITSSQHINLPNHSQRRASVDAPNRLRLKHFAQYNPRTEKQLHPRKHCVVCKAKGRRKESVFWCPDCGVGLCVPRCFKDYHTKLVYDQPEYDENEQ